MLRRLVLVLLVGVGLLRGGLLQDVVGAVEAVDEFTEAVNGPNVDVVIKGVPYDYYDFGSTIGMGEGGYVKPEYESRFYSIQQLIDQGEVLAIKNNGLTAYFGHNWAHIREVSGDLYSDGVFSLIKDLQIGDVIHQDGKEYIVRDEMFFTEYQSDQNGGDPVYYRGYPISTVVYFWPFEEDAVSVQFCVPGGMKIFFAYPTA